MNIARICRRNSRAVLLLTALLIVAGAIAAFRLPSNIYPELTFPRIVILAHAGDLAPQTMLLTVTRPLEEAARTVIGARRVRSRTIRGATEISVLFNPDMDMQYALQLLQAQMSDVRGELPPTTEISVERITPSAWPILMMALNGNVPGSDLRDHAFYDLRPLFSRVPGVANVVVQASETREVSILVDPEKMLAHRLTLVDIADRLRATNDVTSVGRLDKDYARYLVLANGQYESLEDIRNTVVDVEDQAPLRLRDVAEVRDGVEDPRILVYANGKPGALISVSRQIGGNILQVADDVKALASNLGTAIPPTLHLSLVYDLAEFVREAVRSILEAVLIGGLLAVFVLFLFLREGRTTLIASITLPVTVIGTFFFMRLFGGTLNLMSLGGLAIAIGLVIDDAVVIIENIYRHLGLGESAQEAAEKGTGELLGAVVGSTATTVVVFAPLTLLSGVVGEFFTALCLTLVVAVLLSLLLAVTLIPVLAQRFLSGEHHRASSASVIGPINLAYERSVRWALRRRGIVALTAGASLLLAVFFFTRLETGFLPEMDEGGFVLDCWTAPGTSLDETNRVDHLIEEQVRKMPEVATSLRRTGAEMGPFATEQNTGEVVVKLKPRSQRHRDIYETMDELRHNILTTIPGARVEFIQLLQDMIGDMEGNPSPIEVKLFGSSMPVLEELAGQLTAKLEKVPGLVDFSALQKGNPQIVFQVDPVRAGRLGMTVDQVSQQISAGLLGAKATELRRTDRTISMRVRFPDSQRYNYDFVRQFPIVTPQKQIVPITAVAKIEQVRGESELWRENGRLMLPVTARLEGRGLGSAIGEVRKVLDGMQFPVGTTYEIGGLYESQQNSFRDLLAVLALAIAAVLIVLVIQFQAFGPSLIILSAAPLSLLGVFATLYATGTALNVSSFMGIILMVGLVVKNGIILFEYVHKLWEEQGLPLGEALVEAGKVRLRPILMTTLCTLFGLLPLALGLGSGAELQRPLAVAVMGGLALSTFITLLVMPVLYSLLERGNS